MSLLFLYGSKPPFVLSNRIVTAGADARTIQPQGDARTVSPNASDNVIKAQT